MVDYAVDCLGDVGRSWMDGDWLIMLHEVDFFVMTSARGWRRLVDGS